MITFKCSIVLGTATILEAQWQDFQGLSTPHKIDVEDEWEEHILDRLDATGLMDLREFDFDADEAVSPLNEMDKKASLRLGATGRKISALPGMAVASLLHDVTPYGWVPCGDMCHGGPRVLAELQGDSLALLIVTSQRHMVSGPWRGLAVVRYGWEPR